MKRLLPFDYIRDGIERDKAKHGNNPAEEEPAVGALFVPSGKISSEEALFRWIVSDFGLNDAIESGLVKTPRVVVRDDALPGAADYKSRLYHIYMDPEVKDDLNRKAEEYEPLPDLVNNGYYLLGQDWLATPLPLR